MSEWGLFDGTPWSDDTADDEKSGARAPVDFIPLETQRVYFKELSAAMKSLYALQEQCADSTREVSAVRHELERLLDGNIGMFLFCLGYPVEGLEEVARTEPAVENAIYCIAQTLQQLICELEPHLKL